MDNIYNQNICRFIPCHSDSKSIHTINFVLETCPQNKNFLKCNAYYIIHLVTSGSGEISSNGGSHTLTKGDIFFTFPGEPYTIESGEDFSYMYISFLGIRSNMIMEKLRISRNNFITKDCLELTDLWSNALNFQTELSDLASESVLLYTFAFLGDRLEEFHAKKQQTFTTVALIKKYIDDNFSDSKLSLETISASLMYNKKYISSTFKHHMKIGIVEYINTIRIQNACSMIQNGYTSINDIAFCCGYKDSQYFSKVFKSKMAISPKEYIKKNGKL